MKKISGLFILIMLFALVLTGCGKGAMAEGDLPPAAIAAMAAADSGDNSEAKVPEQNTVQPPAGTEGASPSPEPAVQPKEPRQLGSVNQENQSSPADSPADSDSQGNPAGSSDANNVLSAAPPPPSPSAPEDNADTQNTVTISINCQTAVDKGLHQEEQFWEVVPADGIILPPTVMEFKDGETVFDILKQVVRSHKIHMEYEGSKGTPYIQGINNLYEFDGGPLSGWMYCVNKVYPNYGCGEYKLKPGDVIEWNYTCDLGKDLGQTWLAE